MTYDAPDQTTFTSIAGAPSSLTLTKEEKIGGVLEGTYTATVVHGAESRSLSGAFRVCHVDDLLAP